MERVNLNKDSNWYDPKLFSIFYFGFISGFPWVLTGSVMTLWLKEIGLSRSAIGYFGAVFIVYAVNFLWAPLLDRVRIPYLSRTFGLRRSWIMVCLIIIAPLTFSLSFVTPESNLILTSLIALLIAIASATQDIAIDAYRIEAIDKSSEGKLSFAAAAATSGWWAGYSFIGGSFALLLGGETLGFKWSEVYIFLSFVVFAQFIGVFFVNERKGELENKQKEVEIKYKNALKTNAIATWLIVTVVEPLVEFFRRCGGRLAISLLLFVLTFKLGEAFLGRMSIVFYKEIGFSTDEINLYSKFAGGILTVIFSFVGAYMNTKLGVIKGLMIGGIAMASSNLLFSWIAAVGPDTDLLALAIFVDGFTAAFSSVVFIAFISYFTSTTYTATQYALLASLGNLGRTTVSTNAGLFVDYLEGNWVLFFIITAIMVIPSLFILKYIAYLLAKKKSGI